MTQRHSTPTQPDVAELEVRLSIEEDGRVHWQAVEVVDEKRGTIVGSGNVFLQPKLLRLEGIPGKQGDVLPKGVLPALMRHVPAETDDIERRRLIDVLCWAALRRYASHHKCLPRPPRRIRHLAYQAIKRARKYADLGPELRYLPSDFWSGPIPPGGGWAVSEPVIISFLNLRYEVCLEKPIDDLLASDPQPAEAVRPPAKGRVIFPSNSQVTEMYLRSRQTLRGPD